MKARPILFSAPMVVALLAGTKTQTRRIVKPQPRYQCVAGAFQSWVFPRSERTAAGLLWPNASDQVLARCPYGQPGDLLWVREMWTRHKPDSECTGPLDARFAASVSEAEWAITRWKPSIHMPRWASRLTLRITDVRVERLQEISADDAIAEGIEPAHTGDASEEASLVRARYGLLWSTINGHASWKANPWVWALTFEVIKQNVDAVLKAAA